MSDILAPLFEVAGKLVMKEEVPFHFVANTFINDLGNRVHHISWWISKTSVYLDDVSRAKFDSVVDVTTHVMYLDDIDEDKLNEWIAELNVVLKECDY